METITALTGVYRANGGLRGELAYVVGRLRGTAHCGLCDVTHAGVRRRPTFDSAVGALGVPFELVHLDERSPEVIAATGDRSPVVLAHVDDRLVEVLGPDELDVAAGDVDRFVELLHAGLASRGLRLAG